MHVYPMYNVYPTYVMYIPCTMYIPQCMEVHKIHHMILFRETLLSTCRKKFHQLKGEVGIRVLLFTNQIRSTTGLPGSSGERVCNHGTSVDTVNRSMVNRLLTVLSFRGSFIIPCNDSQIPDIPCFSSSPQARYIGVSLYLCPASLEHIIYY